MNLATALFQSSIGRKILMAVTGLVLIGFITGHLVGNLHIFGHPDEINGYAHFLQGLGPALWGIRLVLLACAVLHIWAGVALTMENWQARPAEYAAKNTIQATFASRAMRWTAFVVFAFIAYHLAHFTIGADKANAFLQGATYKANLDEVVLQHDFHLLGLLLVKSGTQVHNVYNMVVLGFQSPIVSGFYILAIGMLTLHLWHGAESMFQTLGLKTGRWSSALRILARVYCVLYLLGNLAIPGSILAGRVQPTTPGAPAPAAAAPHHP
jgi:succinate dehydrogenase / fumarate reductase, cytochrome b subunit